MPFDLAEILRAQLLPWSQHNPGERFLIASPEMNTTAVPPGAELYHQKIPGKRVIIKNRRDYDNTRNITAQWNEAGLNETSKFKLACVLSGHIKYQLGHYRLECGPGHFIFILPGTPHPDGSRSYLAAEKSTSCQVIFFVAHANAIECWLSHADADHRTTQGKYVILQEHIGHLFRVMMQEVAAGDETALKIGTGILPLFLLALQREAIGNRLLPIQSTVLKSTQTSSARAEFVTRLENHLRTNLHQSLTLENVAQEMYSSRAQFTRRVRRETGKSFHELLTAYRLAEAKRLLTNSQLTAATVAALIGLKSDSYFRTFFHRHTGQTPTQFRASAEETNKPEK